MEDKHELQKLKKVVRKSKSRAEGETKIMAYGSGGAAAFLASEIKSISGIGEGSMVDITARPGVVILKLKEAGGEQ